MIFSRSEGKHVYAPATNSNCRDMENVQRSNAMNVIFAPACDLAVATTLIAVAESVL